MTTAVRPLPPHGTPTRYKGARNGSYPPCKCAACVRAHSLSCKKRTLAHIAGTPPLYPAEPLRQHIRTLTDTGMSQDLIARRAHVSHATVNYLMRGLTKGCRREKALRILAVTPGTFDAVAERPVTGTMRRIRALYAIGHNNVTIAGASGVAASAISSIANGHQSIVQGTTAAAITAAYKTLSKRPGTSAKAKSRARKLGWHGPLDWDDIDNPAAQPDPGTEPAAKSPVELQPCGTSAAYRRHLRRSEPICTACRDASRRDRQERDARNKQAAA
ncbi:hypothetical protein OG900_33580 [Streptomyces sp. NBC_00433]